MIDGPNEYCYVNQNPWTKFDPEGLDSLATDEPSNDDIQKRISQNNTQIGENRKASAALSKEYGSPVPTPGDSGGSHDSRLLSQINKLENSSKTLEQQNEFLTKILTVREHLGSDDYGTGSVGLELAKEFGVSWGETELSYFKPANDNYLNSPQQRENLGEVVRIGNTILDLSVAGLFPESLASRALPWTSTLQPEFETATVTSWAPEGVTPDLNPGRWVMLGGNGTYNYLGTGLWGPKAFLEAKFPFVRFEGPETPFANSVTGEVPTSSLRWPPGLEAWKGILGQRQIKPFEPLPTEDTLPTLPEIPPPDPESIQ